MIQKLSWNKPEDIQKLIAHIKAHNLFIGSTDTVIGIMGQVDGESLEKIDHVKIRREKPYVILMDSIRKVGGVAHALDCHIEKFLRLCWPGAVTVVLNKKEGVPDYVGSAATVAVRIPDHAGLQQLLAPLAYGLYSTSANISGEPVPSTIEDVSSSIKDACRYYIDDGKQEVIPSTILDLSQGDMRVIREGAYPIERLQKLYQQAAD